MSGGALPKWLAETDAGVRLSLRVTPRASVNAVDGEREGRLIVRVTAAPEGGNANAAVCRVIAKRLRIGKTSVEVTGGATSREKLVEIDGVTAQEVADALAS